MKDEHKTLTTNHQPLTTSRARRALPRGRKKNLGAAACPAVGRVLGVKNARLPSRQQRHGLILELPGNWGMVQGTSTSSLVPVAVSSVKTTLLFRSAHRPPRARNDWIHSIAPCRRASADCRRNVLGLGRAAKNNRRRPLTARYQLLRPNRLSRVCQRCWPNFKSIFFERRKSSRGASGTHPTALSGNCGFPRGCHWFCPLVLTQV